MKIKHKHYKVMENLIWEYIFKKINKDDRFDTIQDMLDMYEKGQFPRADRVKDLQTRFNFDVWNACGGTSYACRVLYEYMNDSHIATALKAICPTVIRKY